MPSKNSQKLLQQLSNASFALSRVIAASQTKSEGFSKSYLDDKDSFNKLITAGMRMERLLNAYFKNQAVYVVQNINWDNYIDNVIMGAEAGGLVVYRGGKAYEVNSDSYGISTSISPSAAKAYAKAAGTSGVEEIMLKPDAKIKVVDSKGLGIDSLFTYEDMQKLYSKGFDAIRDMAGTIEHEVRILNPTSIVSTRLIDTTRTPAPAGTDLWGATIDWEGQKLNLQITFSNGMYDAFGAGMDAAHAEVGIATRILPTDAPAIKALREYGLDRAKLITDGTKKRIKESLISSMRQGLTKNQAGEALTKIIADPARARMIAHTEQVQAFSEGRAAVGREVGAREKVWDNGQAKACPDCIELHGTKIRFDAQFQSLNYGAVDYPPLHPNCYCGWHMVL